MPDLVSCNADEHWTLLTEFLGFRFDDLSFSFSESDCANPLLMAHMRGLATQFLQDRSYADGIAEYLTLAGPLMRAKQMPARLVEQALSAYEGHERIEARRDLAASFAQEGYGLNETQLICLLFSLCERRARTGSFSAALPSRNADCAAGPAQGAIGGHGA